MYSSPSRKQSFKSTNYYDTRSPQRPSSALQRTTSSRDLASLSSNSSPPSPSGSPSASSPVRSVAYSLRSSPTKNTTRRHSLDAYSSPPRPQSQSYSHSRARSASVSSTLYDPNASPTRIRPPAPYSTNKGSVDKAGSGTMTGNGKENANGTGNRNGKHQHTASRIPTPTPTSPPSPRSQPPNPTGSSSTPRVTPRVKPSRNASSSPKPYARSESLLAPDPSPAKPKMTYDELISAIKTLISASSSSSPRTASPSPSTTKTSKGNGLGSPPRGVPGTSSSSSPPNAAPSASTSTPASSQSQARSRVPSRTQLRHASAARRLSAEGLLSPPVSSVPTRSTSVSARAARACGSKSENVLPDDLQEISSVPVTTMRVSSEKATPSSSCRSQAVSNIDTIGKIDKGDGVSSMSSPSWALRALSHCRSSSSSNPISSSNSASKLAHWKRSLTGGQGYTYLYVHPSLKRKEIDAAPDVSAPPLPYLWKTLQVANVQMIADSANMETLMGHKEVLGASYVTPQSIIDKLHDRDIYYHVWVAVKLALEEKPYPEHGMEEVVRLAFTKLLIELGAALNGCLNPSLSFPHYTFVDPRKLMHPDGMQSVLDQAVAVVEGLEKEGLTREKIYISIPATETGLAIAKKLKEVHSIKTSLTFVSNLAQASICASVAGAAAVTMPVDKILSYHEFKNCLEYDEMSPHPGWVDIKSTACYMKHQTPETQVIGSGWRSPDELEHCASLTSICLSDTTFKRARWHRMRINRPPGPSSHIGSLAQSTPFPPPSEKYSEDALGIRYVSHLGAESPEVRDQCAEILHAGLKSWQEASEALDRVLRWEVGKQMYLWVAPGSTREAGTIGAGYETVEESDELEEEEPMDEATIVRLDLEQYERSKISRSQSPQRWGEPRSVFGLPPGAIENSRCVETRRRTQRQPASQDQPREYDENDEQLREIQVEFPPKESRSEWEEWDDDELDERVGRYERGTSVATVSTSTGSVPPSPYWTDADTFESESAYETENVYDNDCASTSSSSDDEDDMIMIA